MNKVFLIGNLTRDPELSTTNSGISVCRISIAVSRRFANADGSRETDFFNVTAWRGTADNCAKFLKKGNKIAVSGSIQTRNYEKATMWLSKGIIPQWLLEDMMSYGYKTNTLLPDRNNEEKRIGSVNNVKLLEA